MAVLVKNNIHATLTRQIDDHESISLKLSFRGRSIFLFAVYRAPDSPPQFLRDLSEHMSSFKHKNVVLVGDFNLPNTNWELASSNSRHCANAEHLFDIMLCHNLKQVVGQPTRIHGSSASILDLIFVNRSFEMFSVSIHQGLSDHELVYFTCDFVADKCAVPSKTVLVKDFSRARDESVLDCLDLCLSTFVGTDTSDLWIKFKDICTYCINQFIPSRAKKSGKSNPWITREILHLKRKLKRLRRARVPHNIIQMKQASLNKAVAAAKRHYFQNILPNFIRNAPQKFWNFLSKEKKSLPAMMHEGTLLTNKKDIADKFNSYFHSVFSQSANNFTTRDSCSQPVHDLVSQPGIFAMLLNLKTKATPGPDEIPNSFLHRYAEMVSHFLAIIFRASLLSSSLPPDWRVARVVPIHKTGDTAFFNNYRPISLTSSCCKLLEHIVANYIKTFLDDNNKLSAFQHGFRKGFSTVTQLTSVIHNFAQVLDHSGQIDVIFLDFKKAFDLVPHNKLIHKLETIGLPSFIVNWVAAYLSNRFQYVSIDGHCSNKLPVTSGVPQGSVLGPLLFLIYINDITDIISHPVQIRLFADDCVLFNEVKVQDDQILLNHNLHNVSEWCVKWGMELNADKTVFMRITNKRNSHFFSYNLPTRHLSEVKEYKYLGVTLTNNLSWNKHIETVCSSSFRNLCFLRHKLKLAPPNVKQLAYYTMIRPKLEYACTVWDPHTKTNINALERIQRKAVRFIFSKYRTTDSPSALLLQHNIQSLETRRRILRLRFLFLLKTNKLSMAPDLYLQPITSRSTRNRHTESLKPYFARTNIFKFSFFPRTITEWNQLPPSSTVDVDAIEQAVH